MVIFPLLLSNRQPIYSLEKIAQNNHSEQIDIGLYTAPMYMQQHPLPSVHCSFYWLQTELITPKSTAGSVAIRAKKALEGKLSKFFILFDLFSWRKQRTNTVQATKNLPKVRLKETFNSEKVCKFQQHYQGIHGKSKTPEWYPIIM